MKYTEISHLAAVSFCNAIFQSYGYSKEDSDAITGVLLQADLSGVESHGIQRLIRYHNGVHSGRVDVSAKPETIFETGLSAVINANKAMGQLVSIHAMNIAIQKAKQTGIGMVSVKNSNHFGIAAYYSNMALPQDLLGICLTNTEAICVPTFGKKTMLGTNPIAVAMPADPYPFSFDASTTVVPMGKLEVYKKNSAPLPDNWAVDVNGNGSTDASEILQNIIHKAGGGILPLGGAGELFGGHKGYGLSCIVDLFSGIFSGGETANHINVKPDQVDICHFFAAIDYGIFGDKKEMKTRFSTFLQELRDSDKAEGETRIYTHGEKEAIKVQERRGGNITVNESTWGEMKMIASEQKVDFNQFF